MQQDNPLLESMFEMVDKLVEGADFTTEGMELTTSAFTWWMARHGLPQTATDLRVMFEFSARMTQNALVALDVLTALEKLGRG